MRKFAKPILVAAGAAVLVYALAVLGLNIYLQSHGLQARIRAAAGAAVGRPVSIQGTHYTPWSGFSICGILVPQPGEAGALPVFEAASVNFRFAFLQLLCGRLVVKEVVVNSPVLVSLKSAAKEPPRPVEIVPEPPVVAQPRSAPEGGVAIVVPAPSGESSPAAPVMEVRRVRIRDGKFMAFDAKGNLAVALEGVNARAEMRSGGHIEGTFEIGETSVFETLHPRRVTGNFTFQNGRLTCPEIRGDWAGGTLGAAFDLDQQEGFRTEIAADGLLLKKLAADAGISADGARGSLFAKASLRGNPRNPATYTGSADVNLQEARFQPVDFIRQIGDLMSIQELQMLQLKKAEARFTIRDQQVVVENVSLESENLFMDGGGPVGFDGKMKIKARLHMNDKLRRDLRGLLTDNFQDSGREGYRFVPFSITGALSRPKTDLLDKLSGFRIGQDVGGLLKNLFRAPARPKESPASEAVPAGAGEGR